MKRLFILLGFLAILTASLSSCASTRDCNGVKKTRLANGITI